MTDLALLNPAKESACVEEMLLYVDVQIEKLETQLATSLMDRETYLQKFGAATELRRVRDDLKEIYKRRMR